MGMCFKLVERTGVGKHFRVSLLKQSIKNLRDTLYVCVTYMETFVKIGEIRNFFISTWQIVFFRMHAPRRP